MPSSEVFRVELLSQWSNRHRGEVSVHERAYRLSKFHTRVVALREFYFPKVVLGDGLVIILK